MNIFTELNLKTFTSRNLIQNFSGNNSHPKIAQDLAYDMMHMNALCNDCSNISWIKTSCKFDKPILFQMFYLWTKELFE